MYRSLMMIGALALGVFVATAAQAERATTNLSVRSGPGTNHPRVDVIPRGAWVDVGRCARSDWCWVNWRGRDGWAYARYLRGDGRYERRRWGRYPDRYGYRDRPDFYLGLPGFSFSFDDDDDRDRRRWRRGRDNDWDWNDDDGRRGRQ